MRKRDVSPFQLQMIRTFHKSILFPASALIACAHLATQFAGAQGGPPGGAPPPEVIVAIAESSEIEDRIEALGTLRSKESVEITATVSQRVVEIGFDDADRVERGHVLIRLASDEEQALLKEIEATLETAELDYDRALQLAETGAAAQSFLDESRRNRNTARARVLALRSRLERLTIAAPFDGIVGLREISLGAVVRPGDLITTLDDDSVLFLDFSVPSVFLPLLTPGSPIEATTPGFDDQTFQGRLRSVSSRVDPVTRTITARAEIENESRELRPGLLMTVELKANQRKAVMIPEEAVLQQGFASSVYIVTEHGDDPGSYIARSNAIQLGTRMDGKVEVVSGLDPGTKVITHGSLRVSDGSPVRIRGVDDGTRTIREMISNNEKHEPSS